jgi:hypothetical protein
MKKEINHVHIKMYMHATFPESTLKWNKIIAFEVYDYPAKGRFEVRTELVWELTQAVQLNGAVHKPSHCMGFLS